MFPNWDRTLMAISASFHSVAILTTSFRLWYRWYTARMWWDDAWAALAFLADIAWLVAATLEQPVSDATIPRYFRAGNWIISFAYPTLMWSTRISILTSIVRVVHPEGTHRSFALILGITFGILGIAMFLQRLQICIACACLMTKTVLITQTTTDCVADVLLSALPIWFLHSVRLGRKRKILISSALSASMVINIVTIAEVIALFRSITSGSVVFEHVKVACSMVVCNLLVITTFVYRILRRGEEDFGNPTPNTSKVEFTTVVPRHGWFSQWTGRGMSSAPSRTTESSDWSVGDMGQSEAQAGSVTAAMPRIDSVSAELGNKD